MTSPTHRCLVLSKVLTVCGRMLDNLREEKNANKYNGLYTSGNCNCAEAVTSFNNKIHLLPLIIWEQKNDLISKM